ncbi:myocardin-related transcription factor B-like isoform X2 [Myxocyprinus asiaticus]|uniref:myocardin-related transcription factor B-like isoform X2 n=1 Tax=Myxocyprinus asiaticus TaxID=70543 RepID=UPI0022224F4F|nr:myocardin-related transcription factor B-like isoform X2 [Myxocyprinus asiaticus]
MEDLRGAEFGGLLAPSPQSEAVTHEMGELSLHPSQKLPPLNERKNVLQLRLQQRRTREQLVDQGIMPPLKSPAAFHEQIRSLERARTENFLKHKIRSRPERAELVRMHILQETVAEPSLQATQLKLKRARLADDLNEKIAQRPGPMELVEKNILPVDSSVKEAIIDGQMQYPKILEGYPIDEDSGDALSPEQPGSQESQGSASSPGEARTIEVPSPLPNNLLQQCPLVTNTSTDFLKPFSTNEQTVSPPAPMIQPVTTVAPAKSGLTLIKQSHPKLPGDKSRSKKSKEAKPRVKKLKYHQYIPPDQKQEPDQAPMDSSYARLLQQQQLFLQLQILSQQQQQHYNYQTILPAPLKPVIEGQNSSATVAINSTSSLPASIVVSLPAATPVRPNSTLSNRKAGTLPANLEEMKVAELKMELKLRGLPVSGTKTDLIERLKPFQDIHVTAAPNKCSRPNTQPCGTPMEVFSTTTTLSSDQQPSENMSSTPSLSPGSSELQCRVEASMEGQAEAQNRISNNMVKAAPVPEEQDRRLHEKERQIKELLRKLEQEQKLVEVLKMQLEVEKRSGQAVPTVESNNISSPASILASVKTESTVPANCTLGSHTTPTLVKLEDAHPTQVTATPFPQFIISHKGVSQVIGQPQTLLTTQHGGTQILFPMPLANNTTTIQLPTTNVKLQPVLHASVSPSEPGLIQTAQLQPTKAESPSSQQLVSHNHMVRTLPVGVSEGSVFQHGASENPAGLEIPQCFLSSSPEHRISPQASPIPPCLINGPLNKQPTAFTQTPKNKEPPRYEEAVKQTRNLQNPTVAESPTATSQQMDELFDILIESGEMTPFSQQDLSVPKMMPVTASITTLPINTALSRQPAQVQMAPPPALMAEPMPSLASLDSDNQLEALLEGTLVGDAEPEQRTLGLLEELQNQILEQPNSPMDTSELGFSDPPPTSLSFSLHDTGLDNMEWLDLTMPGPIGGLNPLGIASEFLDTHDLQLHWD